MASARWSDCSRLREKVGIRFPSSFVLSVSPDSLFFHHALQRMLMFSGKVHDLRHFGLSYFICIDTAFAKTVVMDVQHNSRRGLVIPAEKALQNVHDELHRRVIVVEDEHAVHARLLGLRLGLGNDRSARAALIGAALTVIVRHAGRAVSRRLEFLIAILCHDVAVAKQPCKTGTETPAGAWPNRHHSDPNAARPSREFVPLRDKLNRFPPNLAASIRYPLVTRSQAACGQCGAIFPQIHGPVPTISQDRGSMFLPHYRTPFFACPKGGYRHAAEPLLEKSPWGRRSHVWLADHPADGRCRRRRRLQPSERYPRRVSKRARFDRFDALENRA